MVFADAAARTTALTGVVAEGMLSYLKDTNAVEVYDGANWVASDDPNAIQNTIVDAKGDLVAASADNVPARLAVGNNGETLVADSSTATGLRYQSNFAAGKNKIINGDFGIWQRGTSFSPASAVTVFLADRYSCYVEGSGTTRTISQQTFTPGTAPVAGYEGRFFLRYAQTVGPSAGIGNNLLLTKMEDVRTFAGQTVTFSFWAKAAATTVLEAVRFVQNFGSGGSPSSSVTTTLATSISIGTSWDRYTYTATVPSISGKTIGTNNDSFLEARIGFPLGSGATFTVDTWGWQVEASNTATAFQTATGTIQGELAACQRYYFRQTAAGITEPYAQGFAYNTTGGYAVVAIPSNMRVKPTAIEVSNVQISDWINNIATTVTIGFCVSNNVWLNFAGTGYTANRPYVLNASSATSHLGFSAEL